MAGKIKPVVALQEALQRGHEIRHRTIRRGNDRGRPGHHVIGRKDDARALKRKRHMVGRMAGRGNPRKRPAVALDHAAIGKGDIGDEIHVGTFGKGVGLAVMQHPRRTVRPFRHDQRARRGLQPARQGRVILVRMADGNMRDFSALQRPHQRLQMRLIVRPGSITQTERSPTI